MARGMEDIPELEPEAMEESLREAGGRACRAAGHFDAGRVLREGWDTVIVGSPNVGNPP